MVEEHEVVLRGASFAAPFAENGEAPILLQRTDEDPVGVLLEKLASEEGRKDLPKSLARDRDEKDNLRLFQPVHRTWHLVLLEVACQAPGTPRLDPQRIASAGLVVRRLGARGLEGWRRAGGKLRGWLPFGSAEERRLDPDPKKRRPALSSGHPEIDRRLLLRGPLGSTEPLEESVSPLFVAPPEVCKAAGKTLLYGLVPLTSGERSEAPAAVADLIEEGDFAEGVQAQIPALFKSRNTLTYSWNGKDLTPASKPSSGGLTTDLELLNAALQHLHIQLDAFDGGAAGRRVLDLLDQVPLPFGSTTEPAGRVLTRAAEVLLFQSPGADRVRMPDAWPVIPEPLQSQIAEAVLAAMKERLATLAAASEGRFDRPDARYVLEAFVRVRGHQPGCPEKVVWTKQRTRSFRIVPWYEAGALPPHQVALPDLSDRGALRKLKPNVAFVLPAGLKQKIDAAGLKQLTEGGAGSPSGWDLGWICGFNIPLITICAFFVLNIFLQLLNIVFFWLPFIKICIPFPRKK